MKKRKIIICRNAVLVFLCLILLSASILYISFYNELITISSIKRINDIPVYELNYRGEYVFDKYLMTGSKNYGEYTNFMNANLLKGIPKIYYDNFECSTFFARTPEGDYILARNLDTTIAIPFVLKTNSKNGFRTVGMANLQSLGWNNANLVSKFTALAAPYYTFDGMNEKGVAIGSLSVPVGSKSNINDNKITLYDYSVIRLTIEKAKSLEDAIKQLLQYNVKMEDKYPSQYMIADAGGNCAVIGYVDGSMKVVEKEGNYQIATNMLLYNNKNHLGYSSERYKAFEKVLSETDGIISVEDALKLLIEHTVPGDAQWSSVYNLTDKTMSVKFYGDYENTYTYQLY
jgi:predicted choloylglycine hydrolase